MSRWPRSTFNDSPGKLKGKTSATGPAAVGWRQGLKTASAEAPAAVFLGSLLADAIWTPTP